MALTLGFEIDDLIKEKRVTKKEVNKFMKWLQGNGYGSVTEQQATQFLLSCDRDLEFAKVTIVEYFKARIQYKELFDDRDLNNEDLQNITSIVNLNIIEKRTKDGCAVIIYKMHDSNHRKFEVASSIKMISMLLDAAIYDYPPTELIMIFDVGLMGFRHMTKIKIGVILKYIHYLQECLPVKLRSIHIVNVVYIVEKIMDWIKPFMKEKLRNQIHMHSKSMDMETFHEEYVEKECLPSDFGGTQPTTFDLHETTLQKLRKLEGFFLADNEQKEEINQILNELKS